MNYNICFNCMNISDAGATVCKHCGMTLGNKPAGDSSSLKIGTVLHGRYIVGKKLGQGGFGITYMGFDLVLSCRVAIKEYYPRNDVYRDINKSSQLVWKTENDYMIGCKNILREAQKLAKVNSIPNVVRVQDTFEENRTAYIIMDYIEGITLKDKIKKEGTIPFEKSISLLKPVMIGLEKLHENGIIHRDISPDNIMINNKNEPYLLDMGAAKDISSGVSEPVGVAKHGFSPVEQYNSNTFVGPWVDVYAMSATIFYCISGKVLTSSIERATDRSVDFLAVKEKLSKKQKDLLISGLEPDYKKRLQSLQPFINSGEKSGTGNGKSGKIAAAVVAVLVVVFGCLAVALSGVFNERVEYMGNSMANLNNSGQFLLDYENKSFYMVSRDLNLYCAEAGRVTETESFVDFGEKTLVGEAADFLNLSEDGKIYYRSYNEEDEKFEVVVYNPKRKKNQVLYSNDNGLGFILYVRTNRNNEYLYLWIVDENVDDESDANLYRYDIKKDKLKLISETASAYSVYDDKIYICEQVSENEAVSYTTKLNGSGKKLLSKNSNSIVLDAFSDKLLMIKNDGVTRMFLAETDGKEIDNTAFSKNLKIAEGENHTIMETLLKDDCKFVYDDSYIYFFENGSIKQVSFDGNEEKVLFSNIKAVDYMSVAGNFLYMQIETLKGFVSNYIIPIYPKYKNENYDVSELCFISKDGGSYYIIPDDELEYELVDDSYIKIKGYNPGKDSPTGFITLPEEIDYYPVKEIDSFALQDVEIEDFLCPYYLEVIGTFAFNETNMERIELNDNLLEIKANAFSDTNLKKISIPASVEKIDGKAFKFTRSLKKINVSSKNEKYTDINGVLFSKDKKTLVSFPRNYGVTSYTVPSGVVTIGNSAFYCADIETVKLPDTVERINQEGLYSYDLKNLKIPDSVDFMDIDAIYISNATFTPSVTSVSVKEGSSKTIDFTYSTDSSSVQSVAYYSSGVCSVDWVDEDINNLNRLKITGKNAGESAVMVILMDGNRNALSFKTISLTVTE